MFQLPNGLGSTSIHWIMSHCIGTSALGDMENVIVVGCIGWCRILCVDMCDTTCNPNLSQYNSIV